MNSVKTLAIACAILACSTIALCVALIGERSSDTCRLTVWDDELLPTAQAIQGVSGKVAYAYPIGDTGKRYRLVIDNNSMVIPKY